jgi:DNA (cytosine-5)-methyltransferase 1
MPRLLDLFSGAGGAGAGYARAGFEVVGVDLAPQPRYPFTFVQGDALEYLAAHGHEFDAIHASPPCQRFSTLTAMHGAERVASHPDLVEPTRELLRALGRPYVIENVPGAPLVSPIMLCGSHFGLGAAGLYLRRHRIFEVGGFDFWPPASCLHRGFAIGVYGHAGGMSVRDSNRKFGTTADWREAMDIAWMTGEELAEAIPPAYTAWIGRALLATIEGGSIA